MRSLAIAGVVLSFCAHSLSLLADELKFDEIIPARVMTWPVKQNPKHCFPQWPANTFVIGDRVNLKELQHYPDRKLWVVEGFSIISIRDKAGYCDAEGKIVIPAKFERADNFSNGRAVVSLHGKYGYIDRTGAFVIEAKFNRAHDFSQDRALVEINGKYGYIDPQGKFVIEAKYESAGEFIEGRAIVRLDDKFGILALDGTWITQPAYKDLYHFGGGIVAEDFDKRLGMIDEHGNVDYENFHSKYDEILQRMSQQKKQD